MVQFRGGGSRLLKLAQILVERIRLQAHMRTTFPGCVFFIVLFNVSINGTDGCSYKELLYSIENASVERTAINGPLCTGSPRGVPRVATCLCNGLYFR